MTGKKCRTFRSQSKVVTVLPESGVHIMLFQHRHRDVFMHNSPITGCTTSSNSNELKHVPLQLFCTVLVLAKDVCVILHNLVHFMGCWIHVNLLMLSDMQALHTQRTFIDHSTFQQLIGQSWACFGCLMKGNVVIIRQYHPNHSRMKRATQVICWKWRKRISSYCEIYRGKQKYCLTWGDQDCLYLISLQSVLIFL